MIDLLFELSIFTMKGVVLVLLILLLLAGILSLLNRGKEKTKGKLTVKNLNHELSETNTAFLQELLPKKLFKTHLKDLKTKEKKDLLLKETTPKNRLFVLHFHGDIKASAVHALRKEVTAILGVATPKDEVVVCIESPGGMVPNYGLGAAQLSRIREHQIPLTVIVDKVAASGGYLMAAVANKILAAPFAIIGSIGVIFQLPNFHRFLKDKNIDFEQVTAGQFKRTLTLFGKNTEEERDKLQEELEAIHLLFKNVIAEHRPHLDINKVATGEYWLGKQALDLQLIDELKTSDEYLIEKSKEADVYTVSFALKESLRDKVQSLFAWLKTSFRFPG